MEHLTTKEKSKLRRLLREFARAQAHQWEDDCAILEQEMAPLLAKAGIGAAPC